MAIARSSTATIAVALVVQAFAAVQALRVPTTRLRANPLKAGVAADDIATHPKWPAIRGILDSLPCYACVNAEGSPLQYERDGAPLAIFYADPDFAQAQLAKARAEYPQLGLRLLPAGLGAAFISSRQGQAVLVPAAAEEAAAREIGGAAWPADELPLFGCLQMRAPLPDGAPSVPMFMSSAEAKASLDAATRPSGGAPPGAPKLEVVCLPLTRAVQLSLSGELSEPFQFIPAAASVQFTQRLLRDPEGAAARSGGEDVSTSDSSERRTALEREGPAGGGGREGGVFPGS